MKFQVTVDVELPGYLRRALAVGTPVVAILLAGTVLATPKQWMPNQALTSADLNALSVVTVGATKYSVGPTVYCGTGPAPTQGGLNFQGKSAYAGGKAMCQASVGCQMSPTAHMCDAAEIIRSAELGIAIAGGWYSTGESATGSTTSANDCLGWETPANNTMGARFVSGFPGTATCDSMLNVLCCD